jgi:hypothetical protein
LRKEDHRFTISVMDKDTGMKRSKMESNAKANRCLEFL